MVVEGLSTGIFKKKVNANRSFNILEIDLGNQPGGIYFLSIISNNHKQQIKLIKQKFGFQLLKGKTGGLPFFYE